ncbi:MAG TPA: M56 family metallopeptidase, partial [Pirellulales bacterium]
MNHLFLLAAQNTVVALLLAVFVYGLTRLWRNPPAAHLLWLLVLLKLVAPPILPFERSPLGLPDSKPAAVPTFADASPIAPPTAELAAPAAESQPNIVDPPAAAADVPTTPGNLPLHVVSATWSTFWNRLGPILFGIWLGGAALCLIVAVTRIVRFERLLRGTLPASERLGQIAAEIAGRLGLRRTPKVCYAESVEVPLLWCPGRRPRIVLPLHLLGQLDDEQAAMILAHELAHLRRRDHWVRIVELIVSTIYWWNPLAWVVRRQIAQAEDLCCDAWVRSVMPDCTRRYAEVLLRVAESLCGSQLGTRLLPASPFLRSLSLKARIEMILESRFTPHVSPRSLLAVALLALLVWPSFFESTNTAARAESKDETPPATAAKPEPSPASELPYVVSFQQGATRFGDGDEITILEVRGTADTIQSGNIYRVKGTYKLASCDQAILLASATVKDPNGAVLVGLQDLRVRSDFYMPGLGRDPGNATGIELKVQRADVKRGTGTFTLFLPAPFGGFPHVSFCSVESGGASFGGNYFGTGDSVLKQWWNTAEIQPTRAVKPDTLPAAEFSHDVKFEQGATRFADGDKITILQVHGTADTMTTDNSYWIEGTYTLASHDRA